MKIQELLVEVDQDALDMRNALSDVAMQELQKIEDDGKRKFDLWQASHRLARSSDIYEFEYTGG